MKMIKMIKMNMAIKNDDDDDEDDDENVNVDNN